MTAISTTTTDSKSSHTGPMAPYQLQQLKKGPKANIVVGPDGDRYIALENASTNLLAYFSPYAQKKLIEERGTILYIPNGSKNALIWIYKYMQAGQADPERLESFAGLTFDKLVLLYQQCAFLDYKSLMARIIGRLKGKFYDSLPSVDEIKLFATSVPPMHAFSIDCLAKEMINPWTCNYTPYLELAQLDQAFGKALDQAMQDTLADRVKVGKQYYQRTTNRQVLWSKKYLDKRFNLAPSRTPPTAKKMAKQDQSKKKLKATKPLDSKPHVDTRAGDTQGTRDLPHTSSAAAQHEKVKSKKVFKCFICSGEGHLARNCTEDAKNAVIEPPASVNRALHATAKKAHPTVICHNCNGQGHIARNCTVSIAPEPAASGASKKQRRPTCFHCSAKGHVARHCTMGNSQEKSSSVNGAEVIPTEASTTQLSSRRSHTQKSITPANISTGTRLARSSASPSKHIRRTQRSHQVDPIVVAGNGEGLRTCDREIRSGEMTRTELVI
ncbi:uncharacterized protein K460DRAFT_418246 [Cucurbitaria berberidis CBS 394.84]|uniref:CCHC-type domain-containing protein n=1 Tax=Cucurbitaria berberidis CBS 394.84 TaxID=1168544 RepID=A0A9P4GC33_9PLEO|nr:uncharacterized protein K460DRAFT_418246 [Cucurbitaria berberidis CBS 394.84]KAF1843123.1 hypothetical protein K460DRAFT_418246 [Cucurbitaria berberidis CBS 394.84]